MSESSSDNDPIGLMAESFLARLRLGERPTLTEYARQHPEHAEEIRDLFPVLLMMERFGAVEESTADPCCGPSGPLPKRLGDYVILREIGRGGMGIVYEAVQESLGRLVALKVLPPGQISPTQVGRFQREARTAAGLHHTHIVSVYGVGEQAGVHYYAMQFIRGRTLDAVLHAIRRMRSHQAADPTSGRNDDRALVDSIAQGLLVSRVGTAECACDVINPSGEPEGLPPTDSRPADAYGRPGDSQGEDPLSSQSVPQYYLGVARVGLQVAEALTYAHQQGVLHRDIKPSNLLIDSAGMVWVTDFGLAKAEDEEALTRTGDFVGTLRYMAPERFRGHSSHRGDVYSLGATIYELLTLRSAFDDSDRPRLIDRISRENPLPPRALDPCIPRDLEIIVQKAMAKDPGDRYATASALAEDLRRFLAGRPILARSANAAERLWRWSRRNPTVAGLTMAVGALLVIIAVGTSVSAVRSRERAEREAKLRDRAEQSETELKAANADLVKSLYFQRIALAQGALSIGNPDHAEDLLEDGCPAPLRGWEWHYLRRSKSTQPLSLRGDADVPLAVAFSPSNGLLLTPNLPRNGSVTVREAATGREVHTFASRGRPIRNAVVSPDGNRLVVASEILGSNGEISACEVVVWDTATGKAIQTHTFPASVARENLKVAFSPDCETFALTTRADHRCMIRVYDVASGRNRHEFMAHSHRINAITFSSDGRSLASASEDQTTKVWDLATGRNVWTLRTGHEPATSVAFSRDGKRLASGSFYGTITIWEMASGRELTSFLGHDAPVGGLTFHPDGLRLASAGEDGTVRVWYAEIGRELLSFKGRPGVSPRVVFSPDGFRLAVSTWDQNHRENGLIQGSAELRVWDGSPAKSRSKEPALVLRGHSEGVICLAFGPDRRSLASGGQDRTVRLWDVTFGRTLAVLGKHDAPVTRVAFTPDGLRLASAAEDGVIQLWDVRTGARLKILTAAHQCGCVVNMAFSPDGQRLASAHEGRHGGVWIWDVETGRELHALRGHSFGAWGTVFSPDGARLVTVGGEAVVKTWNARTGQEIQTLALEGSLGHSGRSVAVAFSPDGIHLARSTYDRTVGIWDLAKGAEFTIVERNANEAWSVEYSPDGRRLATAHWAKTKIWDAATGRFLLTLRGHSDRVRGVAFSPDGNRLASASMDKTVMVWDLPRQPEGTASAESSDLGL